ncbi:hypothetical protein Fot_28761 [Forsythia ovata]|uniref:Uncharacterized protein n=1 Tax=Forsythia ovata TaxID=205694 RepID=A0ABD1TQP5_9LAMI
MVPKLKIRRWRVVGDQGDISLQPPVPRTASVSDVVIPQASEVIAGISSTILSVLRIVVGVSSILSPKEFSFSSEDIRRLDNRRMVADKEGELDMLRRGTQGDGDEKNYWKAKRGREAPSWKAGKHTLFSRGAT